jgi:hypothetical protein
MGFSTVDALYNAITVNKQTLTVPFTRTIMTGATSAAGRWHETMSLAGTGGPITLTGTPGTGIPMVGTTNGGIPIGATVETTQTKHLLSMGVVSPATTLVPTYVVLTDIIHIYPSLVLVTTPSTLSNHPTWTGTGDTRMTDAKGVQATLLLTVASTAAGQVTLNYKDQDGNDQAQSGSLWGPVAATPSGCVINQSPITAAAGGLNMAMAVGDYGVKQVNSYTINANVTGATGCLVLHRPICTIPIALANMAGERDFTTGPIRLPRIYDGACLGIFVLAGGALTANQIINGELVYGWA